MSRRTAERDAIRKMWAKLNQGISKQVAPERFASHLQSAGFISEHKAEDCISTLGQSTYLKTGELLRAASDQITSFAGDHPDRVTQRFNEFVLLLSDELELSDLAQQLADKCRELNPDYQSPLSGELITGDALPAAEAAVKVETNGATPRTTTNDNNNSNSATEVTLEELLEYVGISRSQLAKPCSDEHLREIAKKVDNWEMIAPYLGLEVNRIEDLKEDYSKSGLRSYNAFMKWKEKAAFKATYLYLVEEVFLKNGNATLAQFICNLLK